MRMWDLDDLVGLADIALRLEYSRAAISMWENRYADFPVPKVIVSGFPVFSWSEVYSWYMRNRPSGKDRRGGPRGRKAK